MKKTTMMLAAVLAVNVYGGGFWLTLGNPAASPEAQAAKAVVTVMPTGCNNPAEARVTATAEGVVNGKRVTTPVKVSALGRKGLHAIARQWPGEGKWVLRVVGEYNGATTTALIPVQGDEVQRSAAKYQAGVAGEGEIAAFVGSH